MSETLSLTQIIIPERARKNLGDIESLAESIQTHGLIEPIIISKEPDGSFELVAGGRRMEALKLLGIETLAHGASSCPGTAGYLLLSEPTAIEKLTIEYEENTNRKDFDWRESVMHIYKIHEMKSREAPDDDPWIQRKTGELLNVRLADVSISLRIAREILKGNEEIVAADNMSEATKILLAQKEQESVKRLSKLTKIPMAGTIPSPVADTLETKIKSAPFQVDSAVIDAMFKPKPIGSVLDDPSNFNEPASKPNGSSTASAPTHQVPDSTLLDEIEIPLSRMLVHGDSIRTVMPGWPAEFVDHIVTDIPYGIDMENLEGNSNMDIVRDAHDVDENVELMPLFLREAFRTLREGGYLVFFYDLDHHEKLQAWGKSAGFKVQRWPLFWDKTHPCRNQAPTFNFTKSVETAMVMRKGNATLMAPQTRNIIAADGSVERKMYNNPFAKPFAVWKWIYDAIAHQGQTVLDPFAGNGSATRAAATIGLRPYAIEKDEKQFPVLVETMKTVYNTLTRNKAKFL